MEKQLLDDLVPVNFRRVAKRLAKRDWIKIQNHEGISLKLNIRPLVDEPITSMLAKLESNVALQFYIHGKHLLQGPKVIQPTVEQCEAMLQVDINLTLAEYEQPFSTLFVEFPKSFRERLTNRFGQKCPRAILMDFDKEIPCLAMLCNAEVDGEWYCDSTLIGHQTATIESLFRLGKKGGVHKSEQTSLLMRIAINMCLLLTRYGYSTEPVEPAHGFRVRRIPQKCKKKNKNKKRRAKHTRSLADTMTRVLISQDIKFVKEAPTMVTFDSDSTGRKKAPHWRRGHFRRQRIGKGRTETKLVFIKPQFINSDHFAGTLEDTTYRLRG